MLVNRNYDGLFKLLLKYYADGLRVAGAHHYQPNLILSFIFLVSLEFWFFNNVSIKILEASQESPHLELQSMIYLTLTMRRDVHNLALGENFFPETFLSRKLRVDGQVLARFLKRPREFSVLAIVIKWR